MSEDLPVTIDNAPAAANLPEKPADDGSSVSITLPSGRKAVMRAPNGKHLIAATKILKPGHGSAETNLAIVNRITLIDGKVMPFESFVELPLADIMKLSSAMNENFLKGI
jgi:hypothetical protein